MLRAWTPLSPRNVRTVTLETARNTIKLENNPRSILRERTVEHPHVGEKEPTAVQNGGRELPWEAPARTGEL